MKNILALAVALSAVSAHAAPLIDAQGNYHADSPAMLSTPTALVNGPALADLESVGWRLATDAEITAQALVESEAAAEAYAAKVAAIAPEAGLFRFVLRAYFGEGAETNRSVTASSAETYFVVKQLAGTITAGDLGAATLLERGFESIKGFTGDGTVWSFPWALIPEN